MRTTAGLTAVQIDLFFRHKKKNDLPVEISPRTIHLPARMFREYAEKTAAAQSTTEAGHE